MKSALLTRLKRLEEDRAVERQHRLEVQFGYLKELPPEYAGERHLVTVGRLPDGNYQWEERPGARGAEEDEGDGRRILRVVFVTANDGQLATESLR
jgi:hypothetical protein